jgi:hypothetical protein
MRRIVTLAVALPIALAPAAASAATKEVAPPTGTGPVKAAQATKFVSGPPATIGSATATCPKGTQVVSGGWNIPGASKTAYMAIHESVKAGKRAWRVTGVLGGTTPTVKATLIAYAYCRTGVALKQRSTTGQIPLINNDFNGGTTNGPCPKGTSVVSGGFSIPPQTPSTAGFVHQSSRQNARTWSVTVTAATVDATPAIPVAVTAYCGAGKPPPTKKTTVNAPPAPQTSATVPITANSPKCPVAMLGGGFRSPSVLYTPPAVSLVPIVVEARRPGKKGPFRSSILYAGNATDTTTLTSTGYCG